MSAQLGSDNMFLKGMLAVAENVFLERIFLIKSRKKAEIEEHSIYILK